MRNRQRRLGDLDVRGLREANVLLAAVAVCKPEAGRVLRVPAVGGRADGGVVPARVQMGRLALFARALSPPPDEEEAAQCRAADDDDECEDWERDYEGEVFDSTGVRGGGGGGVRGGEEGLREDSRRADGEGGAGWRAEVAVEAEGFEDCVAVSGW